MIGLMCPAAPPPRGTPSRRTILRGGALVAIALPTATLTGCGIRLQDDAPPIPLLRRRSIPDEAALVTGVREATVLSQMAARVPGAPESVTRLGGIHRVQADVLHSRLTAGGVPDHVIATPTASPTPTAAVSAPPPATVADLAAAERQAATAAALAVVASATTANRVVLAAVTAQRLAAADELGGAATWPAADPLPVVSAATLLEATRSVAYAFEVIAAQLSGAARSAALATSAELAARQRELTAMAGVSAALEPLGYALPFPASTPAAATRLATTVLTSLVALGLGPVTQLPRGSSAHTTLVRLQVQAQHLGRSWGVAPVPFPGMVYP